MGGESVSMEEKLAEWRKKKAKSVDGLAAKNREQTALQPLRTKAGPNAMRTPAQEKPSRPSLSIRTRSIDREGRTSQQKENISSNSSDSSRSTTSNEKVKTRIKLPSSYETKAMVSVRRRVQRRTDSFNRLLKGSPKSEDPAAQSSPEMMPRELSSKRVKSVSSTKTTVSRDDKQAKTKKESTESNITAEGSIPDVLTENKKGSDAQEIPTMSTDSKTILEESAPQEEFSALNDSKYKVDDKDDDDMEETKLETEDDETTSSTSQGALQASADTTETKNASISHSKEIEIQAMPEMKEMEVQTEDTVLFRADQQDQIDTITFAYEILLQKLQQTEHKKQATEKKLEIQTRRVEEKDRCYKAQVDQIKSMLTQSLRGSLDRISALEQELAEARGQAAI